MIPWLEHDTLMSQHPGFSVDVIQNPLWNDSLRMKLSCVIATDINVGRPRLHEIELIALAMITHLFNLPLLRPASPTSEAEKVVAKPIRPRRVEATV